MESVTYATDAEHEAIMAERVKLRDATIAAIRHDPCDEYALEKVYDLIDGFAKAHGLPHNPGHYGYDPDNRTFLLC